MTLEEVLKELGANRPAVDCPWELFRVVNFPGRSQTDAAQELGEWATLNGLEVEFVARGALSGKRKVDVIHVILSLR